MKSQNFIKQLVGKAIGHYNREIHNDCRSRVEFYGDKFTVHTTVAKGDNVPWAEVPMNYVRSNLYYAGIKAILSSENHCQGNVSMTFIND